MRLFGSKNWKLPSAWRKCAGIALSWMLPKLQIHPFIRDWHNSAGELPRAREVRDETLPQSRYNDLAVGANQPFVQRGDNIRILVGSDHIVEALHVHVVADTP